MEVTTNEVDELIVLVEGGLLQKGALSLEEIHGIESARKFNESNAPDFAVRRLLKTVADSMMGLAVAGNLSAKEAIVHLLDVFPMTGT